MIRLLKVNGFTVNKVHGTYFDMPIIPIRIPVGPLHMIGWVLIFECTKKSKPKDYVLTREGSTHRFIKVKKDSTRLA
jgi:hypothetical protein